MSWDIVNRRTGMLGAAIGGLLALTAPAFAAAPPASSSGATDGEVHLQGRLEVLHSAISRTASRRTPARSGTQLVAAPS
jgi:hypothetical protein